MRLLKNVQFLKGIYIYFDELEVFYRSHEQYARDMRMVRDILFANEEINNLFSEKSSNGLFVCAVRTEILDAMGTDGKEVSRLVHDHGFEITWHRAQRGVDHPLMNIIRQKITASEKTLGKELSKDPISQYFPKYVNNETIDQYILDRSFYKPRDIVWRLNLAQEAYPEKTYFSQEVLDRTNVDYSARLWDEVKYELGAAYTEQEIEVIEQILSGKGMYFDFDDFSSRFSVNRKNSTVSQQLIKRKSLQYILEDLFRVGAIGNAFKVGGRKVRNKWIFRGDPNILTDQRMQVNPALAHRLSLTKT